MKSTCILLLLFFTNSKSSPRSYLARPMFKTCPDLCATTKFPSTFISETLNLKRSNHMFHLSQWKQSQLPQKHTTPPLCPHVWYTMITERCDEIWNVKIWYIFSLTHSLTYSEQSKKTYGLLPVITVWLALLRGHAASFAVLLWGFWAFLVVVVLQLKLSPSFGWQRRWSRHG